MATFEINACCFRLINNTQSGGVQKRGTDIAALIVRRFEEYSTELGSTTATSIIGYSHCLLFYDTLIIVVLGP